MEPREPESSRKPETGIGKKEVRQGEHHMQLGGHFFDSTIPYLATFEKVFNNAKDMFDLTANGRFQMFSFSGFTLTTFTEFLQRGRTAHDFVFDLFSLLVASLCPGTFFGADITAVGIDLDRKSVV